MDCVNHPGIDAPYNCFRCRAPICVDCESKLDGSSICRSCLAHMRDQIAARYQAETRGINYCGAFITGAIAASAVAYLWSLLVAWLGPALEFMAAVLGGTVGYAVRAGAGEKRGRTLQQLAAALTLFGVILGHYLVFIRTQPGGRPAPAPIPTGSPLMAFPGYLSGHLDWLAWVFLAAGLVWAYCIPRVRRLPD